MYSFEIRAYQQLVHYRVYEENGEVVSKTSFDENDSSLGRINILSIPPPHSIASLKSHLSKAEGASGRSCQLFEDEGGEITMKDDDNITSLTDSYPGASEEEPIAVVYSKPKEIHRSQRPLFHGLRLLFRRQLPLVFQSVSKPQAEVNYKSSRPFNI